MKQIKLLLLSGLAAGGYLSAQNLTSIQIRTNPNGPVFYVDGAGYTTPQTFTWPVGSKHIVQYLLSVDPNGAPITFQNSPYGDIHYVFNGWTDGKGLLAPAGQAVVTVNADSSLTTLVANVTVQYHVRINFGASISSSSCAGAPGDPSQQTGLLDGVVYFDGVCVAGTTDYFLPAGPHNLNAFPFPGWVFFGWNINGNPTNTFLSVYDVESPATLIPLFSIAKRLQLTTNPPGLKLLVDRSPVPTPPAGTSTASGSCLTDSTRLPPLAPADFQPLCLGQFDLLPGSKHQLAATSPQLDALGNYWVFSGFSDGLGQNSVYTADYNTNTPDNVIANFNPGVHASIFTNPIGLKLLIDGQTNTTPYNVIWGQGDTHQLGAPAQQTDSHGRVWTFSSWSNDASGSATQTITVPGGGLTLAANYSLLGQAQVTSIPPGLTFTIDGNTCVTPCVINKSGGAQIQVTVPASVPSNQTSRFDFASWSDGNTATSRQVSITQDTFTLYATYQTSYLLTTVANPANAATFKLSPPSPDGFFGSGTPVTVTVTPNNGYKFLRWEGDYAGTYASGTLTMTGPHAVIADLASVPFIPSAGVQTAAGPTPDGSVGPGSIIAIYGQNLAPAFQMGPSNPLAQTIGDVTATVSSQLLPLLYVSPDQLAAQVPWELPDGTYTLQVHSLGQPDVTGSFTVSRDAPALFTLPKASPDSPDLPVVLALHQDGTVITASSPARLNEQISLYGTGFGPYDHQIPDGFPAATTDKLVAVDPVTVTVGSVQVTPDATVAATGMVGMTVVKIKITDALPSGTTATLTVSVNGKISSPVSLPLQ